MKKCFKKAISGILASAMLFSSAAFTPTGVFAADFGSVGGWFESIYAEIPGIEDADVTGVSYSGTMSGSLAGEDLEYLVRDYNGGVRIDIPGLQAGNYTLTVNTSEGTVTKDNISVMEYDRSGYAHFNYTEGVGAYNDDGTLKDNAVVLYVTDENKEEVSVTAGGVTVTGIGNILNSVGATPKEPGALTNTNQGILLKLAQEGRPLVVRIIGEVTPPQGLTAYDSVDYGGTEGDNGFMARMQNAKDITIEGIGPDASINGWGIHFVCGTAAYQAGLGKSCEIRNIYFQNYPEDAFGAEGQQEGSTLTAPVERIWVHNNNFGPGYCKNPTDSDKSEGDGSCDFKRGQYYTMAYNKYWDCHKTNLIGSSDSSLQYHMTMHHNYYENCMARGPLARQGNIHMYNNVYVGQTDYAMNTRANAYIFSEYNLLYMCKNPMRVDAGAIKSYNDSVSCYIDEMGGTVVTDKNQQVSSGNRYENFDTDPSLSYIPSGDYILQENVAEAKKVVMAYSGVMKENVITPDEVSASLVEPGKQPSASVSLPYSQNLNSTYLSRGSQTKDNIYFSASKVAGDNITIKEGQAIVFNVNTNANITITDGNGNSPVVLLNDSGIEYLTGSGTAYNVPAGTYFIQPNDFTPAKNGGPAEFKEARISYLGIEVYDPNAPTQAEPTTQATTEGSVETTTRAQGGDIEDPTEETTEGIQGDPVLMGTYNFGDNASGGDFNITEKRSAAGNMTIELRDVSGDGARVRKDDGYIGIAFNLTQEAEITISYANRGVEIYNTGTGETIVFERNASPQSVILQPGSYSISGNDTGSNSTISQIVLRATGNTPTESTTEMTTETTEATTESATETTEATTAVTESSSETTTEDEPAPGPSDKVYGDVNDDGKLDINDASELIDMVLKGAVEVKDGITDVTGDGKVDTADIATILQKILDSGWKMPCEPDDEDTTESTTDESTTEVTTAATTENTTAESTTEVTTAATTETTTVESTTEVTTAATTETTTAITTTETTTGTSGGEPSDEPTESTTEGTTETTTEAPVPGEMIEIINANDLATGTYYEDFTVGNFVVKASNATDDSGKDAGSVVIDPNNKSIDNYSFTKRLKTGGAGTVNERTVMFTAKSGGCIVLYAMSSNSEQERNVNLLDVNGEVVYTLNGVGGASIAKYVIPVLSEGTYYLGSESGGLNIYLMGTDFELETPDVTEDTTPDTSEDTTESTTEESTEGTTEGTTEVTTDASTETTTEGSGEGTTEPVNDDTFYDFNDNPVITKDGTEGIVYTVSTKEGQVSDGLTAEAVIVDNGGSPALYLNDASETDTVKATLPLTEKSSGAVTYTVKLNPSTNGGNWTIVQFNGVKADDTEGEVLGVRTDKDKNYGLRVNGGSTVTSSGVAIAADTAATVTVTVDFDNDKATLSVNGSAPVTVTGVDAKSITSMSFQTATGARSLYADDAGITVNGETPTEGTTETPSEGTTEDSTEDTTSKPAPAGSVWTAGDEIPGWLNLNGAEAIANSSSHTAFANMNGGSGFAQKVNLSENGTFTVTASQAGKIIVYAAADNNADGKGELVATADGNVIGTYNMPGRKNEGATAFEVIVDGAKTVTFTPGYKALLFKVEVQ